MALQILVTGGAGFLGSSLCEALIADGHRVVALDSLFRGSLDNIAALKWLQVRLVCPFCILCARPRLHVVPAGLHTQ